MDVAQVKQRQRAVWGGGDYRSLSHMLEPAAVALCEACAVSAGQEVLDVAAGDGNFALAAAREGAAVVASDLSPGMVERGRARTSELGFEIEWREADAEELPFGDARFDCVGSVFGAMIAPRPERVASELFRVARPGGTVGMTAWTRDSFASAMFDIGRKYVPPPPDMPLAKEWGDEEVVKGRFDGLAATIEFERARVVWEADSIQSFGERLEATPVQAAAKENMPAEHYEAMQAEQLELAAKWNSADNGSVRLEAEYLISVARKRG
ncbi:MAG TPA: class I SAM-dependent methyltransferase [Thermoleophilaceae bacterium]|nr:class I SAM-dependent methyltransferase [Thermoleophilaceae bacterium]